MNPDSNKFEKLCEFREMFPSTATKRESLESMTKLLRPDGSPVPDHWSVFTVGEEVVVKNYTFKVGYIGESTLLLEPVGPVIIGETEEDNK